jgi:uncharacterized protein YmfQ (DUF2313 family)
MIFELLRTNAVDLMRYLPAFLASDPVFSDAQKSLSTEHEKQRQLLIDIAKQFFVETATWGLDDWERIYGLTHDDSDGYQVRRERLKLKIQGIGTVTLKVINTLVNSVVPTNDATVVENVAPNVIRVDLATAINAAQVRKIIDVYKPAHLTCIISHKIWADMSVYIGGYIVQNTITCITPAHQIDIKDAKSNVYIGGIVHTYSTTHINS